MEYISQIQTWPQAIVVLTGIIVTGFVCVVAIGALTDSKMPWEK